MSYIVIDSDHPSGFSGGDPHIITATGAVNNIPNDWKYFCLYHHNHIRVCVRTQFLNEEILKGLHTITKSNEPTPISKRLFYRIKSSTYMSQLDVYDTDKIVASLDLLTGQVLLDKRGILDLLHPTSNGIYSVSNRCYYHAKNLKKIAVHLDKGNFIEAAVDTFWDEINSLSIHMSDTNFSTYKGEFFEHDEKNLENEDM